MFITNRDLYETLYASEVESGDDFEIQEIIPQGEDDVNKLLSELKREGIIR